jgi:hypothetical protein
MPEEFDPENLQPPQNEVPGGPAVKSRGPSAAQNAGDKLKQQGVKAAKVAAADATKAALVASGVGAGFAAVGGKVAEWATEKVLNKGYWKALLLAQWPTFATIGIVFMLLLGILAPAFSFVLKANKGAYGKQPPGTVAHAAIASDEDISDIQTLIAGSGIDYAAIRSWHLLQAGQSWSDHPYGDGKTIGSSGCGPTSAAMVLNKYGKNVTAIDTADFCLNHGYRASEGTDPGCFSALASNYGLKAEEIDGWDAAKKVLESGQPLIVDVHHSDKLPKERQFTSGGHFIVLAGVYKDQVIINDPGPRDKKMASVSDLQTAFFSGYFYIHP